MTSDTSDEVFLDKPSHINLTQIETILTDWLIDRVVDDKEPTNRMIMAMVALSIIKSRRGVKDDIRRAFEDVLNKQRLKFNLQEKQ